MTRREKAAREEKVKKRQMPPPMSLPTILPGCQRSRCQRRNQRVMPQMRLRVARIMAGQKRILDQTTRVWEVLLEKARELWLRIWRKRLTERATVAMSQRNRRRGRTHLEVGLEVVG